MYGFHGFSKSLLTVNYSCSDLTAHCQTLPTSKVPCLQKVGSGIPCSELFREGTGAISTGTTAALVLRTSSCKDNTVISYSSGTPNLVTLCKTPLSSAASSCTQSSGVPREVRHSPTCLLYSPCFTFDDASCKAPLSHSILCFLGFFFFLFLSYWWRLPLCGKRLHGRCSCKIPLAVACEMIKGIGAFLASLREVPRKHCKTPR